MDRRLFIGGSAATGLLAFMLPARAAVRRGHAEAMAESKARIHRLGIRLKASGWTDLAVKDGIAAEARVYAGHYRALKALAGRA